MAQNTSSAVMQQRNEPMAGLDDFPTPSWSTRALCDRLGIEPGMTVREPCANRGYMARPLGEYFGQVLASDIHDYGAGYPVSDYLFGPLPIPVEWTITNPPFRLAQEFIERALASSTHGVAMFLRTSFVEGQGRYHGLFSNMRPSTILHFAERVVLHEGRLRDPDVKYWDPKHKNKDGTRGAWKKPTTATSYSWFIWEHDRPNVTVTDWIAPCRPRLTRPGDYDLYGNPPEETSTENLPDGHENQEGQAQ